MSLLHWLDDYLDLENLLTRWGYGGAVPAKEASERTQKILSPPATYVGATTLQVSRALRRMLREEDKPLFEALSEVMEGTSSFEFLEIRRRMKNDFLPFCAAALQDSLVLERGEEDAFDEDELDERELRFLENFDRLMTTAQYKMLSRDEWQAVEDHDFTFMMPVEVNWERNDRELLKRFWERRPADLERGVGPAAVADRVLVYHRGLVTARASGLYLDEKVDLLVQYLVVRPCLGLMERYGRGGPLGRAFAALFGTRVEAAARHADRAAIPGCLLKMHGLSDITDDLNHQHAKVVYRSTLAMLLPNTRAVLHSLFKRVELREPQFKSVVVLYRNRHDSADARMEDTHEAAEESQAGRADMKRLLRRNIFIKRFADVPIADAEIFFPERTIFLKPVTLLEIMSTIAAAVITAITTMWGGRLEWSIAFSAMSILFACGTQVYASAHMQRQQVEHAMAQRLYEITQDAQDGVLHTLLDEMKEQHNKEVLLAYTLLLTSGEALTETELDERCEEWLADTFNLKIDFGISDAVEPLLQHGLIIQDTDDKLRALPLDAAIHIMRDVWGNYFASDTYRALHHSNSGRLRGADSGSLCMPTSAVAASGPEDSGALELASPQAERRARMQSSFQHLATSARALNRQSSGVLRSGDSGDWERLAPGAAGAALPSVNEAGAAARPWPSSPDLAPPTPPPVAPRPVASDNASAPAVSAASPRLGPRRVRAGGELSRSELLAVMRRQAEAARGGGNGPALTGSRKHIFVNKVFGGRSPAPNAKAD